MKLVLWTILFLGAAIFASQSSSLYAGENQMKTAQFSLSFAANGLPLSLKTNDSSEMLNTADPGKGFYLKGKGEPMRLENISYESGRLIACSPNLLPAVTFSVHETDKYIAFRIEKLEAVPASLDITLHFEMKTKPNVKVMALDYMTEVQNYDNSVVVNWHYLAHRHPSNPLGGFALYVKSSDDDEDDTILRIWTGEQLPHPIVKGAWDLKTAREWVKNWQATFFDPSQIYLEGKNVDELRQAADYAQKAGVRQVFLFTHVWREDPFWPYKRENCYVNRNVFPKGEEDLRAFSDYLHKKGMLLTLHYVSGGIGPFDPKYVGSKPDRRLASWGGGTIAQPADPTTTTLLFKPNPGIEMPSQLPQSSYMRFVTRPPMLDFYHGFHYMRVEDEMIQVGAFENTDQPVWTLTGCQRGLWDTNPAPHQPGADAAGLIDAYWQNLVPDNDSTLLPEMADTYAGLLNRCHIWNVMYDGGEIHRYNGEWGYEKFTTLVYGKLDHPVIGMSSGGVPAPCQLEYRLNSTRKRQGHLYPTNAGLELEHPCREATTIYGANFELSQACANNCRLYGVIKPEPMFAISLNDLKTHGQTDSILKAAKDWKEIDRIIDDKTRAQLLATFRKNTEPQGSPNHWPISDVVHMPREKKDCWELIPTTIMTLGKADIHWQNGQEFGTIVPRQNVQTGQELKLSNPFKSQPPRAIIRNFAAFSSPEAPVAQQAAAADGAIKQRKKRLGIRLPSRHGGQSRRGRGNLRKHPHPARRLRHQGTPRHPYRAGRRCHRPVSFQSPRASRLGRGQTPRMAVHK